MAVELKTQWEDADKGRAELARDTYLAPPTEAAEGDEVPDDPHKAIPGKLPTKVNFVEQSEAKLLTPELRAEQLELVQKSEEEFNQQQSGKVDPRAAAATKWSEGNEARIGAWEEVKAGVETCYNEKLKDPRVAL